MPALPFISDETLELAVTHLITVAATAKQSAEKKFGRNVIDPFAALFEMAGFELSKDEWRKTEMARQAQKTLQNDIGYFHQRVLGGAAEWAYTPGGQIIDIESDKHQIIAEIKNKHNTLTGGQLSNLYYSLEDIVMTKNSKYKGYTAYYVEIIPKKPTKYNIEFTPSDKSKGQKCATNPKIRKIDGASFYEIVTGVNGALTLLYDVLPNVIEDVCKVNNKYVFADKDFNKQFFIAAFGQ